MKDVLQVISYSHELNSQYLPAKIGPDLYVKLKVEEFYSVEQSAFGQSDSNTGVRFLKNRNPTLIQKNYETFYVKPI